MAKRRTLDWLDQGPRLIAEVILKRSQEKGLPGVQGDTRTKSQ